MMLKIVLTVITIALLSIVILFLEDKLISPGELPELTETCWSKRCDKQDKIEKFTINVSQDELKDLKSRISLDLERMTNPLDNSKFNYGFNANYLKELAKYWTESYDWKSQEKLLNSYPQYRTRVDGLDIHFVHVKPTDTKGKKIVPLLLVHGWPGSFVEFLDIIPLLTAGDASIAYEVIAPSIPGYGFSSAPEKPGFNGMYTAKIFRDLMIRLGHDRFYCQGGDWGSMVTTLVSTFYPDNVLGLHINMGGMFTNGGIAKSYLAQVPGMKYLIVDKEDFDKVDALFPNLGYLLQETGYMHIQGTKPDTVGVGLSSSPLGLAAYIMEKFSTWTNRTWRDLDNGGLDDNHPISKDKMLTNVMVYWITNTITSSMRYYKENFSAFNSDVSNTPVQVPFGFADFPNELMRTPKFQLKGKFPKLVSYNTMFKGGHFAAMEVPDVLARDFMNFVAKVEEKTDKNKQKKEL